MSLRLVSGRLKLPADNSPNIFKPEIFLWGQQRKRCKPSGQRILFRIIHRFKGLSEFSIYCNAANKRCAGLLAVSRRSGLLVVLFGSQTIYRFHHGCFHGLITYRQ